MEEVRQYEIGYLLTPLIPAEEVETAVLEVIRRPLEAVGGLVMSEKVPTAWHLAYPIGKVLNHKRTNYRDAYFGALKFTLAASKLVEFKEKADKQDKILRYLLINQPAIKAVIARPAREIKSYPNSLASGVESKKTLMSAEEIDREIEDLLVPAKSIAL